VASLTQHERSVKSRLRAEEFSSIARVLRSALGPGSLMSWLARAALR